MSPPVTSPRSRATRHFLSRGLQPSLTSPSSTALLNENTPDNSDFLLSQCVIQLRKGAIAYIDRCTDNYCEIFNEFSADLQGNDSHILLSVTCAIDGEIMIYRNDE